MFKNMFKYKKTKIFSTILIVALSFALNACILDDLYNDDSYNDDHLAELYAKNKKAMTNSLIESNDQVEWTFFSLSNDFSPTNEVDIESLSNQANFASLSNQSNLESLFSPIMKSSGSDDLKAIYGIRDTNQPNDFTDINVYGKSEDMFFFLMVETRLNYWPLIKIEFPGSNDQSKKTSRIFYNLGETNKTILLEYKKPNLLILNENIILEEKHQRKSFLYKHSAHQSYDGVVTAVWENNIENGRYYAHDQAYDAENAGNQYANIFGATDIRDAMTMLNMFDTFGILDESAKASIRSLVQCGKSGQSNNCQSALSAFGEIDSLPAEVLDMMTSLASNPQVLRSLESLENTFDALRQIKNLENSLAVENPPVALAKFDRTFEGKVAVKFDETSPVVTNSKIQFEEIGNPDKPPHLNRMIWAYAHNSGMWDPSTQSHASNADYWRQQYSGGLFTAKDNDRWNKILTQPGATFFATDIWIPEESPVIEINRDGEVTADNGYEIQDYKLAFDYADGTGQFGGIMRLKYSIALPALLVTDGVTGYEGSPAIEGGGNSVGGINKDASLDVTLKLAFATSEVKTVNE